TIVRLSLTYSQDAPPAAPTHLFLKLSRPDSHQHVVGSEERRKEVELHSRVAVLMPQPPVVCCYRAAYDAQTGASYLLFDDVAATHFGGDRSPMPRMAHWEKAIDSFAAWHAFWWDHPALPQIADFPSEAAVTSKIDGIRECYARFADFAGDHLSSLQRQIYGRVLASLPRLLQRASRGRRLTLIHGDANPSNVLLPYDTVAGKALIIDWQLWGVSYATEDLSHMIALYWDKDQRSAMERALLMRYHDQLVQHGVTQYDWADCWYDYRLAVIDRVLFMPMWFWNAGAPSSEVWSSLKKAMQAFDDLQCVELLND
ncbi:MAG TPA: phosphotransferase, partial [Anaerolineae bacterium]